MLSGFELYSRWVPLSVTDVSKHKGRNLSYMFCFESLSSYQYLIRVFNAKQKELMSFRVC